jgi:hypothetical protein
MADEHNHVCLSSAELCGLSAQIDEGDRGEVVAFACVLVRSDGRSALVTSSNLNDYGLLQKLLVNAAELVLAHAPAPTDTRN